MKNSCVAHPHNEPLIIIRKWQVEFCDGDPIAAGLMSYFEYWHNIKLEAQQQNQKANEIAANHGDDTVIDTSLYQWHTEQDLIGGIMDLAKTGKTISKSLDLLVTKKVISIHRNPNPKYKFDKTRHFLFYPEIVNEWLLGRSSKNASPSSKNAARSGKMTEAIPEITTEITTENISAANATAPHFDFLNLSIEQVKPRLEDMPNEMLQEILEAERQGKNRSGLTRYIEHKLNGDEPTDLAWGDMFKALADLCEYDTAILSGRDRGELANAAKAMLANGYTKADIKGFSDWWYADDWRRDHLGAPKLHQVRSEWGRYKASLNGNGHKQSNGASTGPQLTPEQMAAYKAKMAEGGHV